MTAGSLDEGAVPGSHVERRARRQYPVKTAGERTARAAEHGVPEPGEPAVGGPVPGAVRLIQLRWGWPGRRRGHAAPGAPHPSGAAVVGIVQTGAAPRPLGFPGGPGARPRPGGAYFPRPPGPT